MRSFALLLLLLAISYPSFAQPDPTDPPASATDQAQRQRNAAQWSDLEAQGRALQGDYDGAVQAHQQAEREMQEADRQQTQR